MKNKKKLFRLTAQKPDYTAAMRRAETAQKERNLKLEKMKLAKRLDDRSKAEIKHRRRIAAKRMDDFEGEVQRVKETLKAVREKEDAIQWCPSSVPVWWSPEPQPVYTDTGPDFLAALLERDG